MSLFIGPNTDINKKAEEGLITVLKDLIDDDNGKNIIEDHYFEWKIKDWSDFINVYDKRMYSLPFTAGGHSWMIKLKSPHNEYHREEKYLRICLANKTNDNEEKHTLIKFLISFRNSHSYTSFKALPPSSFFCISNVTTGEISSEYAYPVIVNEEDFRKFIQPLIKDDILILCMNFRIYNNAILEKYLSDIKSLIKDDDGKEIIDEDYYEWKVVNLDIKNTLECSPNFTIGHYQWGIELSCVKSKEYLALNFYNRNATNSFKEDEKICINCVLSIRNANDFSCFHAESTSLQTFTKNNRTYSFPQFFKISDLFVRNESTNNKLLFEDGKIIVGAYVRIYKNEIDTSKQNKRRSFFFF